MDLSVLHQCPQCGAEIKLAEADRVLDCPFCRVRHILATSMPRFILPHSGHPGRLLHVPYLRCKGSIFSCHRSGVEHRVVDTTVAATPINVLPPSLGYRPQAMAMRYASAALSTSYLNTTLSIKDAIAMAGARSHAATKGEPPLYQEWIGETISLIYLPLLIDHDRILDGVTGDALARVPTNHDVFARHTLPELNWQLELLPAICPNCGWDLDCQQESIVHLCRHCDSAWQQRGGTLGRIPFATVPARGEDAIHLPFWRLEVDFQGIGLHSLADFIRLTNLPRSVRPEWENEKMIFYCPAFKIRPQIFLRVASQLTAGQRPITTTDKAPTSFVSVSLPPTEAEESIKLILAHSAVAKRNILPKLPEITVSVRRNSLVFLPFFDNGYELCQEEMKVVINKQIVELGKKL